MLLKFFLRSVLKSNQFWLILAFLMALFKNTCISLNACIVFNVLKLVYTYAANIYLFKVVQETLKKWCETCSKLTIKTPELLQWLRSGVFIVNFEPLSSVSIACFGQVNICCLSSASLSTAFHFPIMSSEGGSEICPTSWNYSLKLWSMLSTIISCRFYSSFEKRFYIIICFIFFKTEIESLRI